MDKHLPNQAEIDIYHIEKIGTDNDLFKLSRKSKPLFQSLKILYIYELNMYAIALFMYSYFSNNLPKYFNNYFILNKNMHSYDTSSASNILIDYKRTNYGKFSLKHRGAQIWNNLPIELKSLQSYNSFKRCTKIYVQNHRLLGFSCALGKHVLELNLCINY